MSTVDPVALAADLIALPSVTPDEAGTLDLIEGLLRPAGFACHRLRFEEPGRAPVENLYARFGAAGRNLCLAGHVDVVPPGEPADWRHGPFVPTEIDGMLYGRGAADMKSAVAAFVTAAIGWAGAGPRADSVSLLLTADEEGPAVNGTKKVLDWLVARGERLDMAIVGEPTSLERLGDHIKIGRRGSLNGRLTVTGVQGHVAYPERADNPIPRLLAMLAAIGEPLDGGTAHFPPSNLELVTVDVGNRADNVIPAAARAGFNIRFNDRHSAASLEAWLRERFDRVAPGGYALELRCSGEAFLTSPGPFVDAVVAAIAAETGVTPSLGTGGGTSDARFIARHCPVLEFGLPGATAHKVDEAVAVADIRALARAYRAILDAVLR